MAYFTEISNRNMTKLELWASDDASDIYFTVLRRCTVLFWKV